MATLRSTNLEQPSWKQERWIHIRRLADGGSTAPRATLNQLGNAAIGS
jgi:hypothetical protein